MEKDAGRCVNCGFLCKRRTVIDAESIIYEATSYDRKKGTFYRHSGWPDRRDIPTQPACFRNAAHLQKELVDALTVAGQQDREAENKHTLAIIGNTRKCKSWYQWTECSSPKEHLEDMKIEQLQRFNRNMSIFFAIVAFVTLAVGITAMAIALITLNNLLSG